MPRRHENARPSNSHRPLNWGRLKGIANGNEVAIANRYKNRDLNEFTRQITGFGDRELDLMKQLGLEGIDYEQGLIEVGFTGVSEKPKKRSPYTGVDIVCARGVLVLSGLVSPGFVNEIGQGSLRITQLGEPSLDSHNSPRRLNICLGREDEGLTVAPLSLALSSSALALSVVTSINGEPITAKHTSDDIEGMWRGLQSAFDESTLPARV